jgi:hypothetical protein
LAEGSFGCGISGSKVRKLSKMCKRPETTFVANSVNTTNLTIAKMGPGFVGSTPTGTRQLEVCCCHTRISGVQSPGANIITRCAGTKSHTYDESWHRIECHNFTIGVLYKINNYIIRRQQSSNPKLTGRRRPRSLTNSSQHPPCASSCGTCS